MNLIDISTVLENRLSGKVVVVGVGNRNRKDDGIGVCLSERLKQSENLIPVSVEELPELHMSNIIDADPDVVMFVDSVELGNQPGSAALIEKDQLSDGWGNPHQPPLSVIMKYISKETGADTFLLGLQPEEISQNNNLSPKVNDAVNMMSEIINNIFSEESR
jgi:hydrogenase 3 maturation protease